MEQITIQIPGMQSTHCQTRVSNAVKTIQGVQVLQLDPGKLTVSAKSANMRTEIEEVITHAGYTVSSEEKVESSACTTSCCSK